MNFEETFYGRPSTIKAYTSLFRNHIKPHIFKPSMKYDDRTILALLRIWEKAKLSPITKVTLLRLVARHAKFIGEPEPDIIRYVRNINRSKQEPELLAFSKDEALKLMMTCKRLEPRFYPILLLGLHAGLRRGEVFGLVSGDLDFIKGVVKVSKSYDGPTKNGKTRYVPLGTELMKALINFSSTGVNDKLFKIEDPNPRLRRICAHARIPELNFHSLRHTYATLALEAGTSPKKVQMWLGHSSLVTTLGTYWNVTSDDTVDLGFLPGENND